VVLHVLANDTFYNNILLLFIRYICYTNIGKPINPPINPKNALISLFIV